MPISPNFKNGSLGSQLGTQPAAKKGQSAEDRIRELTSVATDRSRSPEDRRRAREQAQAEFSEEVQRNRRNKDVLARAGSNVLAGQQARAQERLGPSASFQTPALVSERLREAAVTAPAPAPIPEPPPASPVTIEGISISSGESPVTADVTAPPPTVSIVQDAADEELKRLVLERTRGPLPVIVSATRLPELTPTDADTLLEVAQFEKRLIVEAVESGLRRASSFGLSEQVAAAKEEAQAGSRLVEERTEALAYMLDALDTAASGLNVSRVSGQIMQRAAELLQEVAVPTEGGNSPLPTSLDDYISLSYPRVDIDATLTNTGRLALVAQDTALACLTAHPTVLANLSRPAIHPGSLFSVPGAYRYDPDGEGSRPETDIPTVSQLFSRNERTIVGQFLRIRPTGSPPRAVNRKNAGFLTLDPDTTSGAGTEEEMWDDVIHSICALSNELILSAGIGRLQGSKLGARFLERRPDRPQQYDPLIRVLGFSPSSTSEAVSRFISSGPDRAGSLLDLLALGEEVPDRELIVMPFEPNTVVGGETPYVSGRQYFVEMAAQLERPDLRAALRRFATQFSGTVRDVSSYLTELMALDVETPLAPELLLARILQDFRTVIASLSDGTIDTDPGTVETVGAFSSALFALGGFGDTTQVRTPAGDVLVTDVLKMSVVRALRDLDGSLTDTSFVLSQQGTSYSADGSDSAEGSLSAAVDALATVDEGGGSRVALGSTVLRLVESGGQRYQKLSFVPGGRDRYRQRLFLDAAQGTNLINLVARTVRELQKEAANLAARGGAKSDYRNSTGGTLMSDCDDDRLIDVVTTIYTNLAYLILPVTLYNDGSRGSAGVLIDRDAARLGTAVLEDTINSLVNGARISADDVQARSDIDPSTPINLSPLGDNTAVTTPADVADLASRSVRHRYYIKAGLKVLEAAAAGVTASSAKASRLFDVLSGALPRKELKGAEATLHDLFVTGIEENRQLLRGLSPHQANLCALGRRTHVTAGDIGVRRDMATTTPERLALRDYARELYRRPAAGLQVLTVGIPSGLIDSLYNPALELGAGSIASRGLELDARRRSIRIELDRFDNVYFNSVSTVTPNIFGTSPSETEFDPEVFILPGDIAYDPASPAPEATGPLDAIFLSTTFTRLRSGRVAERLLGSDIQPQDVGLYFNALRSYLLDLLLYDTVGVRHLEGAAPVGPPRLSRSGYEALKAASGNPAAARALLSPTGFIEAFDPSTRAVRSGEALRTLLNRGALTPGDIKFAASLACASPLSELQGTVRFRPYERVYHFLYDEAEVRSQITGDTLDVKARRRQFDIYSLAARVSYGGDTSGS